MVYFSVFVPFAFFAVYASNRSVRNKSNRRKLLLSVSLCSRRSRRSRFMLLKRSFCCLSNRETRENREKFFYDLFLLVRTVRVVRGSWFSTRVSAVILTAKHAKIAKSFSGLFFRVRVVRGSCFLSIAILTAKCSKTAKVIWSLFSCSRRSRCSRLMILKQSVRNNSLFALFAVHVFQPACPLEILRP